MNTIPAQIVKARPGQPLWCDFCSRKTDRLTLVVGTGTAETLDDNRYACDGCVKRIHRHELSVS